jgi:Raf kinase inhibitor-like YbhB/YbcL family protein
MDFTLTSAAFADGGAIDPEYTCDGADRSPPLAWNGAPASTESFVLIVDDPDAPDPAAPKMTWVHWILYNLPPSATELPAGVVDADLPSSTKQGLNDWGRTGYGGPCPPIGRHRYFHKLYALDMKLADLETPTKVQLERAMSGHVVAQAQLVGTYERRRR